MRFLLKFFKSLVIKFYSEIYFKILKSSNIVSYSIIYVSDFNAFTMSHILEARYTVSNIYIKKTQHACHV